MEKTRNIFFVVSSKAISAHVEGSRTSNQSFFSVKLIKYGIKKQRGCSTERTKYDQDLQEFKILSLCREVVMPPGFFRAKALQKI
jgi:hypothetical protein